MATRIPDSATLAQNGSNSGRNGDFVPFVPATGPGRRSTTLASRSRAHSSSAMPRSGRHGFTNGVAKILCW